MIKSENSGFPSFTVDSYCENDKTQLTQEGLIHLKCKAKTKYVLFCFFFGGGILSI